MTKNFLILICLTVLLLSCGKKGDPIYNQNNQNSKILNTQYSKLS